jgi:tRNA pseudouridine synthase 10
MDQELTQYSLQFILDNMNEQILDRLTVADLHKHLDTQCEVGFYSPPIFLSGNYLKYSRFLSQTPWEIEGKIIFSSSVQELIAAQVIKFYQPQSYKFHTGGREDIDVRMLGSGRPFVLELISPKKRTTDEEFLEELQDRVNNQTSEDANVNRVAKYV